MSTLNLSSLFKGRDSAELADVTGRARTVALCAPFLIMSVFLAVGSPSFAATFTDMGADFAGAPGGVAAWGDYDNDGDLDLALEVYDSSARVTKLYRNDDGSFVDTGAALTGVPTGLAWGDYDNDGDLDLALAGSGAAKLYRNDDGSFVDTGAALTGVPTGLAWGDYDNDGGLDLALAGYDENRRVTKLFRNDGGSFADAGADLIGVSGSLAWGDCDNDGDLDLALAGYNGFEPVTKLYRNDGATFADAGANLIGVECDVAWGDYDNDGDLDLAVAGYSYSFPYYSTKLYRNDGGTFADAGAALTGVESGRLAWGDYDNDGDLDLALTGDCYEHYTRRCVTKLYRNDGGTFADARANLIGVEGDVAWGDYDNDGDLDLLVAGYTDSGRITKLYRNESGITNTVPSAPGGLTASASGSSIALRWNAATDAETPSTGLSYNVRIGTSPGKGDVFSGMADWGTGFRKVYSYGNAQSSLGWSIGKLCTSGTYYCAVQAVDTAFAGSAWSDEQSVEIAAWTISGKVRAPSGEGVPSLVVTASDGGQTAVTDSDGNYSLGVYDGWSGTVTPSPCGYLFTPGSRRYSDVKSDMAAQDFAAREFIDAGAALGTSDCVAWGDYDNDGDLDLALGGWGTTKLYRNDGGTFVDVGADLKGVFTDSLAWGDYDNDGDLDLALAGGTFADSATTLYRNDCGTFVDVGADLVGVYDCELAWGDYDNDGDLDLALAGGTEHGPVTKLYRNNSGTFADVGSDLIGVWLGSLAWGDYDNDGDLDLAVAGAINGPPNYITRIYRNDGGTFVDVGADLVGVFYCELAWGDCDNDGDLDLAVAGSGDEYPGVFIYRNDGGSFAPEGDILFGDLPVSLAWGDYDNDGDADLAVGGINWTELFRNDSGSLVGIGAYLPSEGLNTKLAWGDYDNDGDLDLAVTGDTRIYRNDGAPNIAPCAPDGLTATPSSNGLTLAWEAATDLETPSAGLSYNIRVGTSPGAGDIFSGMADPMTGLRRLAALGNAQKRLTWSIGGISAIGDLYCSVQAIDTAFAGSPWSPEVIVELGTAAPRIDSVVVNPSICARGDRIRVTVVATDDCGVSEVTADGVSLAHSELDTWAGYIAAPATMGPHQLTVVARDAHGRTDTDTTGTYNVAPVVATNCRASGAPVMLQACHSYLFKFVGRVSEANGRLLLDDGSGTPIEVVTPAHDGICSGDYASARGILDPVSLRLVCQPEHVNRVD